MFLRKASGLFLLFGVALYSCNTNHNNGRAFNPGNDTAYVIRLLTEKKIDSAFFLANAGCNELLKKGNPGAYINFNRWLIKKFPVGDSTFSYIKLFHKNIFLLEKKVLDDTALLKDVTNSLYQWAEISNRKQGLQNDSVINCFENALRLDNQHAFLNNEDKRYACQKLGIIYNQLGDVKKTFQYYQLQKQATPPENHKALIAIAINLGVAFIEVQKPDSAIAAMNEVLPFTDLPVVRRSNLLSTLAAAYTEKKDYIRAKEKTIEALAVLDTVLVTDKEVNEKRGMAFKQKGIIELRKNSFSTALSAFINSLASYHKNAENSNRDVAKIYKLLGDAYKGSGFTDSALWCYHKGLSLVAKVDSSNIYSLLSPAAISAENTIIETLDAKADIWIEQFNTTSQINLLQSAVSSYSLSFTAEEKLMQNFSYDESRMLLLKESKQRSEKAIAACYQLYTLTHSSGWAEKAFLFTEKSKAIALQESVKRNIAATNAIQQDTNWQLVQHYQQQVSFYEKEIAIANDTSGKQIALLTRELNNAEKNLLMVKTALLNSNSTYRESLLKTDSLSADMVSGKLLDRNTSLIEYFSGSSDTYIFYISSGAAVSFLKADSSLQTSAQSFLSFFTDKTKINNNPSGYQSAAFRLYNDLKPENSFSSKTEKLLIIPDGLLNFVPFEALVTKVVNGQNSGQFTYLLLQKQISYGYSASTLIKQTENNTTNSAGNISCYAPVFAGKERGYATLQFSEEEMAAIKKQRPSGKYYLKQDASVGNFKKNIATSSIIHIASHAHADTSGTLPAIEFFDSTLYINEIYSMHMAPRLVVLSACETGIGKIDKSEGAMSLARAFYYAGAKNIITSLWSVDDKSTAGLFSRFYAGIRNNDYSQALYNSKLDYIKNATDATASPYYWAGFVHIGYAKEKKQGLHLSLWLPLAASLTILMAAFYFIRKRK
jgi:CHAT domain-containing protein